MILRELRVRGWRNLASVAFRPGPNATVLFGSNGQGKTNLLEAAYCAVTFRSFRTKVLAEALGWGQPSAAVEAGITVRGLERKLQVQIGERGKVTSLDGKAVRRDSRALEGAAVVLFSPDDLRLPKAPAAERRRFLDGAVFGSFRPYYLEAHAFERALRGRNALLRGGTVSPKLIETYDEQLASAGARIVMRRRGLVEKLAPRFSQAFDRIHGQMEVALRYRSGAEVEAAETTAAVEEALRIGFARTRALDVRRGFTTWGPQTDDLDLTLGGHLARDHGSQGQLRSLVLALKIAELENLRETLGEPALLLLDDVASELDRERRGRLFESIAALGCQSLITVTELDHLPPLPGRTDFEVAQGQMRPAPSCEGSCD